MNRRRVVLAAILVVAFALRLAWALFVVSATRWSFAWDASFYDGLARDLADGRGFLWNRQAPTAYMLPGYPFLLAGAYWLFGKHLLVAKLVNVVLATWTCFFTYRIGSHAYGPRVGLLAAAIFACFPGDIYFASTTLSDVPFVCVLTGSLWAGLVWSDRAPPRAAGRWLLLGALLGIAALIRGVAALFAGVFCAAWWLGGCPGRVVVRRTGWLLGGTALAIAPWAIRNLIVLGSPILLSTGAADVLFNSHSEHAGGGREPGMHHIRARTFPELMHLPRPEQEVALSRAQLRYAVDYAFRHPLRELRLAPARLAHLYQHDHAAFRFLAGPEPGVRGRPGNAILAEPWKSALAAVANVYFFAVAAIALVGFVLSWSRVWRRAWLVPLAVAYFQLVHAFLFLGEPRYHAPLVPLFCVLAALALDRAVRGRPAREAGVVSASLP